MKHQRFYQVLTILIICLGLVATNFAQSKRPTKKASAPPCDPDVWTERSQNVVRNFNTILYVRSGIIAEITDENGNPSATGSFLHIKNEGDQQIEFQLGGGSPFFQIEPGEEEYKMLPIYRSKRDKTPTNVRVNFHYKCDSNFPKQLARKPGQAPNGEEQQNDAQQPQQTYSQPQSQPIMPAPKGAANQPFPYGCWVFPAYDYYDKDYKENVRATEFYLMVRNDGQVLRNGQGDHYKTFEMAGGDAKFDAQWVSDYYILRQIGSGEVELVRYYQPVMSIQYAQDDRVPRGRRSNKCP